MATLQGNGMQMYDSQYLAGEVLGTLAGFEGLHVLQKCSTVGFIESGLEPVLVLFRKLSL